MQKSAAQTQRTSLIERASAAYQLAEQLNARAEREAQQIEQAVVEAPADVAVEPIVAAPAPVPAVSRMPGHVVAVDHAALAEAGFILPDAAPSALAEEFRIVKRQLLLSAIGGQGAEPVRDGRAILVASAEPDEGKTFCAVNLAMSLARERALRSSSSTPISRSPRSSRRWVCRADRGWSMRCAIQQSISKPA